MDISPPFMHSSALLKFADISEMVTGVKLLCGCRYTVDAGGVTWAYRKSDPAEGKADPSKPQVLLLHGLGSSSYSYR